MNENRSREEVIAYRLNLMAERAMERRAFLNRNKLIENGYIRIRSEDYKAVSLNDKTPLCGFTNGGGKKLSTILAHFKKVPAQLAEEVWKQKKERRIQCLIIKHALLNGGDINSILNLDRKYDELFFALDEVSLGDSNHEPIYRCDILAVGKVNGKFVPVLIELKSERSQDRLIKQLTLFSKEILKFKNEFGKLLTECVGKDVIVSQQIEKMLIWPCSEREKKETIKLFHNDKHKIDVVEYEWDYNNPESIMFHFRPYNNNR